MQVAQMFFGMIDGSIEPRQTPNYDKLLTEKTKQFIFDMADRCGEGTYVLKWDKEKAITKTVITSRSDGDGRKELVNNTFVIKFDDILQDILDHTPILCNVEKGLKPLG